ncbi:4-hydroxythreonine-4-phosphate dehydrogenase [Prochlorococcus sp. MIT 1300]|uniref:4-hydroxythreonine-4-phosphate dehydrogenase n=1 Tax=Prochlorococcus sp. MIT 1300 TaxID=3096218 RepID=UPI002A74FEA3|nr:4-hydroxythreonine-4-phosphate dehydrogenase [Prochlorococcus sp. MIT 1300]
MLRLILLGLLFFGLTSGLRDGWLVIKWSQLLNQVGFAEVDPDKPLNWNEFLFSWLERNVDKSTSD